MWVLPKTSVAIGCEFWSNFPIFRHFWREKIKPVLEYTSNMPQNIFSDMPWLYFTEKTSKATKTYIWNENAKNYAEKVGNPEKNQNFVKKKSHGHKNAWNQKSLCAKLLLHIKMNCTQGFCLILNCYRVSFIFNSKFSLNMAKIASIS